MSTVVKDLGAVSAYAYAVEKGYTGTEAEFAELMADYAVVGQRAEDAANSALESKTAAKTAANTATTKASEATTAAQTATTKAGEAQTSAQTASTKASEASQSASTASTKASEATTAAETANTAKTDAETAKNAAETAQGKAEDAQGAAEDAAESVNASAAQIAQNTSDITELKSDLTTKADLTEFYKAFPTDTASGAVASFADGANVPVKSLIVNIDPVQSGSGDSSPDNVRPISGWSEVNVQRSGKNLFDKNMTFRRGYYDPSSGAWLGIPNRWSTDYIRVEPGTTLTRNKIQAVDMSGATATFFSSWTYWDEDKHFIGGKWNSGQSDTVPDGAAYLILGASKEFSDSVAQAFFADFQLEVGSSVTPYEPYIGQSINIPLGQTVYGGKLDVVSGEVNGTWYLWEPGDDIVISATNVQESVVVYGADHSMNNIPAWVAKTVISNRFSQSIPSGAPGVCVAVDHTIYFGVNKSELSSYDRSGLIKWLKTHPTQFAYQMSGDATISKTTPVTIPTLYGYNTVYADSGDSEVTYRADPTLHIQRLTEPDADMIADANITSGSYFMVGNTLYKATDNIASGTTISPNVNCTRKSLSEALNEINA